MTIVILLQYFIFVKLLPSNARLYMTTQLCERMLCINNADLLITGTNVLGCRVRAGIFPLSQRDYWLILNAQPSDLLMPISYCRWCTNRTKSCFGASGSQFGKL